jgi:hypothetical protein
MQNEVGLGGKKGKTDEKYAEALSDSPRSIGKTGMQQRVSDEDMM